MRNEDAVRAALSRETTRTVFQPIVSLEDGREVGYEALSRPQLESPMDRPDVVLSEAMRLGLATELDRRWREIALEAAERLLPSAALLFVNVAPDTLARRAWTPADAVSLVRRSGFSPDRIVLELTERDTISDFADVRRILGQMRAAGFLLAIDDVGAGTSTLQAVAELRPDFVKLDRWLTYGIKFDSARRSIVESMVRLARGTRARVIAEGIENVDEIHALVELGVDLGQGFLLGRPSSPPPGVNPEAVSAIARARASRHERISLGAHGVAGDLANPTIFLPSTAAGSTLWEAFENDELLDAVAIDLGGTIGFVTRHRAYRMLGGQFGYSLRARVPVADLAERAFSVDATEALRDVAYLALRRPSRFRHDPVAVMDHGHFAGAIDVTELFARVLDDEVSDARDVNPLTGLAGNRLIRRYVSAAMAGKQDLVCLYVDIDHFKQFNDRHGFAAGDLAIAQLGVLLQRIAGVCSNEAFVGHIGGDDFVMVFDRADAGFVETALARETSGRWFDPESHIEAAQLSLSAGGVCFDPFRTGTYEELASALSGVKNRLKQAGGDRFAIVGLEGIGAYAEAA